MRALTLLLFVLAASCATVEKGAAKDPMKCERDPACTGKQDKSKDCYTVCSDDIACVERCRQVNGQR